MDGWESFALAQIGAAAALAGLVLVGTSVNLERVLAEPGALRVAGCSPCCWRCSWSPRDHRSRDSPNGSLAPSCSPSGWSIGPPSLSSSGLPGERGSDLRHPRAPGRVRRTWGGADRSRAAVHAAVCGRRGGADAGERRRHYGVAGRGPALTVWRSWSWVLLIDTTWPQSSDRRVRPGPRSAGRSIRRPQLRHREACSVSVRLKRKSHRPSAHLAATAHIAA